MAIPMVPMETQLQSIFEEVVVSPSPERRRGGGGSVVGGPARGRGLSGAPRPAALPRGGVGGAVLKKIKKAEKEVFDFSGALRALNPRGCETSPSASAVVRSCCHLHPGGRWRGGGFSGLKSFLC